MNVADATKLLTKLGCTNIKINTSGTWVDSTCPLAIWTHKKGSDNHPSFGISIHWDDKGKGESKFKCYSCGVSGSLTGEMGLLRRIKIKSKMPLPKIDGIDPYVWVDMLNEASPSQLEEKARSIKNVSGWKFDPSKLRPDNNWSSMTADTAAKMEEAPPPLSEAELDKFTEPSLELMTYFRQDRRLTDATIKQWELKWHEKSRRVAIPIRDVEGRLVGVSGRAHDGQRPKFLHSKGFRKDFYLYGERTCRRNEPGYLTEGFFDVIYLQQKGVNAFAVMGTYMSKVQVEKCVSMFSRIIVVPDGDQPGEEAADRIQKRLGTYLPVVIAPMAEGKDPDDLSDEELDALRRL